MINVHKDFDNPPLLLLEEATKFAEKIHNGEKPDFLKRNIYTKIRTEIKQNLHTLYHGKCAYCEISIEHSDIDDYRPKNHYYWLLFEWSNLLPVCAMCNRHKRDNFPTLRDRIKEPQKDNKEWRSDSVSFLGEEALILHPEIDTPENHLYYDQNGIIYPKTERGRVTIQVIGLNRPSLIKKRRKKFDDIAKIIFAIVSSSNEHKELTEEENNKISQILQEYSDAKAEFSLFGQNISENFYDWITETLDKEKNTVVVDKLRKLGSSKIQTEEKNNASKTSLANGVKSIKIHKFQDFREEQNIEIGEHKWVFLTGENGFGKTSVLQAIALGLVGIDTKANITISDNAIIQVEYSQTNTYSQKNRLFGNNFNSVLNLAAYGSSRLNVVKSDEDYKKNSVLYNLFNTDGIVKNINTYLGDIHGNPIFEKQFDSIRSIFQYLLHIEDIEVDTSQAKKKIFYIDDMGLKLPFEQLAAGYKNIIAMIGDIILRLSEHQKGVPFGELKGIVIIDEFDLHLHPKWQRKLPAILTEIFPHIQFIVSTHSPIPLLGASYDEEKNIKPVILKVTRNVEEGIKVHKLDINPTEFTPNAFLTSDVFDMDKVYSVVYDEHPEKYKGFYTYLNFKEDSKAAEELNQRANEAIERAKIIFGDKFYKS